METKETYEEALATLHKKVSFAVSEAEATLLRAGYLQMEELEEMKKEELLERQRKESVNEANQKAAVEKELEAKRIAEEEKKMAEELVAQGITQGQEREKKKVEEDRKKREEQEKQKIEEMEKERNV